MIPRSQTYTAPIALAAAVLSMMILAGEVRAQGVVAENVDLIAIDTDTSGNDPTTVGAVDVCSRIEVGDEYEVDVVVQGIPELDEGGELVSFEFVLHYDGRYVEIIDADVTGQLLGEAPGSNVIDFTNETPDDDGQFTVAAVDFGEGADESGDGVLARLTLRGIGQGTSDLALTGILLHDSSPPEQIDHYEFDTVQNGLISVGVDCAPNVTPPPYVSATPTATQEPGQDGGTTQPPGESPDDSTPVDGETPPSDSPGPGDDSASPSNGADGDNSQSDDDDDDDGSGTIIIIAAVVVAILLAAAGAGYLVLRRRGGDAL
ncbi:MAG TPA: cohesin domain-containing protein [Dehalococcoidia bacterium]|nr:cohesin domain-containing protein [Dehalococcoidia bacterium]